MIFTCASCRNSYDIPDEKLPSGKKVAFPCPKCKARLEIDLRPDAGGNCRAKSAG
jgi:hypothetical protein